MEKPNEPDATYDFAPRPAEPVGREHAPTAPTPATPSSVELDMREAAPKEEARVPVVTTEAVREQVCPVCGLKMVGVKKRARCTECGSPLDAATADFLQFADRGWVRAVAWGPLLMGVAVLLQAGGVLCGRLLHVPDAPGMAQQLTGGLCLAAGAWLATRPDPRATRVGGAALLGWVLRLGTLMVAGMWGAITVMVLLKRMNAGSGAVTATLLPLAAVAALLAYHLRGLAARVPSDGLAAQFQNLMWLAPAVLLYLAAHRQFAWDRFAEYLFFFAFPMAGALVGMALWAAISLVRLGLEVRSAAAAGETAAAKRVARESKEATNAGRRR